MSGYVKHRALQYSARYHQIAEALFKTGRISLTERWELVRCAFLVGVAIGLREVPPDTLPAEYCERVNEALARADMGEPKQEPTWN